MQLDFSKFFEEYEKILQEVDAVFERVRQQHPEEVACVEGVQRLLPRHVRPEPHRGPVPEPPFCTSISPPWTATQS